MVNCKTATAVSDVDTQQLLMVVAYVGRLYGNALLEPPCLLETLVSRIRECGFMIDADGNLVLPDDTSPISVHGRMFKLVHDTMNELTK